jgi:hypothetical protein
MIRDDFDDELIEENLNDSDCNPECVNCHTMTKDLNENGLCDICDELIITYPDRN